MSARKRSRPGYGRLLDAWVPPEKAGDPVGCVATTYTFDPAFFEEECLGRFLGLETDPVSDGPLYLVEREEKLAQLACAGVLADAHHCRGSRSLRWDLLSARVAGAVQHAKISLLVWTEAVRLVVASANLTPDAYRRNLEVFGVLDYHPGGEAPLACLRDATVFLRRAAGYAQPGGGGPAPASERWEALLDRAAAAPADWGRDPDAENRAPVRVFLVVSEPEAQPVLDQVQALWPAGGPPDRATVLSPFFDPPEAENRPARELWAKLRQRGEARTDYLLTAEEIPGGSGWFLHAPRSILEAQPAGRPLATGLHRLETDNRLLHAKTIRLENDRWSLGLVGSSNFTSHGLGLAKLPNLEANLAYLVDGRRSQKARRELDHSLPDSRPLGPKDELRWKPRTEEGEDLPAEELALPSAFAWATYRHQPEQKAVVLLGFAGKPPKGWWLALEDQEEEIFYEEQAWRAAGSPSEAELPWLPTRPPSGFRVGWAGAGGRAWWPVNVESAASLPPPEELKDLPLAVLIDILTSSRPLYRVVREYVDRGAWGPGGYISDSDPHKRVDTSGYLLQRTRRVSWALAALKRRLELPVASEQCLEWRLRGPVGVGALAKAIQKEALGRPEERAFLLCELALELASVQPKAAPGCLPAEEVRAGLSEVIAEIKQGIDLRSLRGNPDLRDYVNQVFQGVAA